MWREITLSAGENSKITFRFNREFDFLKWNWAFLQICIVKGFSIENMLAISQGTFAKVFKTGDGCAAKVFDKTQIDPSFLKKEIDIHRQLDHE